MRARDTINNVLNKPVPSATQLIIDYEEMVGVLHLDCHQAPQTRTLFGSPRSAALVNLMTNVTEQLEGFYSSPNVNLSTHHSSLCSICLKSFTRRSDNCYFERSGHSVQSSATFRVYPTKRCGKYFIHSIHLFNYFYASSASRYVDSPTSLRVKLSTHFIRPYCDVLKPSSKFVYFLHSSYSKSAS